MLTSTGGETTEPTFPATKWCTTSIGTLTVENPSRKKHWSGPCHPFFPKFLSPQSHLFLVATNNHKNLKHNMKTQASGEPHRIISPKTTGINRPQTTQVGSETESILTVPSRDTSYTKPSGTKLSPPSHLHSLPPSSLHHLRHSEGTKRPLYVVKPYNQDHFRAGPIVVL
ncbi:hypothetical protein V6N13_053824 [Hibiscus sabdariffa]|uniref:Uncharacterized protein n=1 Tax=Hibiscus sabdariffa TaxID=183260 RepID=A0ABR2T6H1_9ROSI